MMANWKVGVWTVVGTGALAGTFWLLLGETDIARILYGYSLGGLVVRWFGD